MRWGKERSPPQFRIVVYIKFRLCLSEFSAALCAGAHRPALSHFYSRYSRGFTVTLANRSCIDAYASENLRFLLLSVRHTSFSLSLFSSLNHCFKQFCRFQKLLKIILRHFPRLIHKKKEAAIDGNAHEFTFYFAEFGKFGSDFHYI